MRCSRRFFGGWELPTDLCEAQDFAAAGYAGGVPMGAELSRSVASGPRFAVSAWRDAGSETEPGTPLQRLQLIKLEVHDDQVVERIVDVAGSPESDATVDPRTCEQSGTGHDRLCAVWTDPDFDAGAPALYYVRVVENPSCRWSTWACNAARVDCADPGTIGPGYEPCCDASFPSTTQERAWSSPIWYTP
jgi:hypothetical protein